MPDDPADRLRRSRTVQVPALLVLAEQDLPDHLRRFCANPVVIPIRIDPKAEAAVSAARQLQRDVKTYIGTSIQVELKAEGGVERSMGKAKRVVDLRVK